MSNSKTKNSLFFYGKEKCVCRVFPICVEIQYCEYGNLDNINKMLQDYSKWSASIHKQTEKIDNEKHEKKLDDTSHHLLAKKR